MRIKWLKIIMVCLFVIPLASCRNYCNVIMEPSGQANTNWKSADSKITFSVQESYEKAFGNMIIDSEAIEFFMIQDMGSGMYFYSLDSVDESGVLHEEGLYAEFYCSYISKDQFVATVVKSRYLPIGEEVVFHKE